MQKEYNDLKRKYERQAQVLQAIADSGCITMIPLAERIDIYERLSDQYGANVLLDALSISKGSFYNRIKKNRVPTYYETRHDEFTKWFTGSLTRAINAIVRIKYWLFFNLGVLGHRRNTYWRLCTKRDLSASPRMQKELQGSHKEERDCKTAIRGFPS